ncbi:MAG: DUF695 domain-containing protein [Polyangiaceae bacterium]|nr:DUF695 domain-containing protein [Polyangiaceae bacterium]
MGTISTPAAAIPDEWEFYLCRVDDAPASILLNTWYGDNSPIDGAATLYWCTIAMLHPTENGMGDSSESEALKVVEDRVGEWAMQRGLFFVGRMRSGGIWQLTYYGAPGIEAELKAKVKEVLGGPKRKMTVGAKPDPGWSYFHDFLWPDAERLQWMKDRKVVEELEKNGDPLVQSRRVDHWVYFSTATDRDEFVEAAKQAGFALADVGDAPSGDTRLAARLYRTESVELDDIHAVVMSLHELARDHRGEYDGWETSVEKPRPN